MKTVCEQKTLELAHSELTRFNGYAKLNVDPSLLSFEIRCTSGAVMISGPTAVDVLYGVYDFAERYLGYCFFEPGRDRFSSAGGSACQGACSADEEPRIHSGVSV